MTTATDLASATRAQLVARLAAVRAADALAEKLDEAAKLSTWTGAVTRDATTSLITEITLAPAGGGDGWRLVPHRVDGLISEFVIEQQPEET